MSPYLTLPEASRSSLRAMRSWPAPSATTMTAWPRRSSRCRSSARNRSSVNGTSGIETEVHLAVDEHRIGRDESRVASHQLHQADAVARGLGLGVGRVGRPPRLGDRGLETEGSLHERDVVVDRLRHADDADLQAPSGRLLADRVRAAKRPVAADREQDADAQALESSTIAAGSCGPRDDPRIEPPISWIRLTASGVSSSGSCPQPSTSPSKPKRNPYIFRTP